MQTAQKLNTDIIKDCLQKIGFSQSDLAKALNVSREAISQWLNNKKFPRPGKLLKLSELLKLSFNEIVTVDQETVPKIFFRKRGNVKTRDSHYERASDMGELLKTLVPFLPYDILSKPPTLINPELDYFYLEKAAEEVRKSMNINGSIISHSDIISFFNDLHAVVIPVLWGKKETHENALHIYLPDSMTTWVYLNLDINIFDFKFWMAHELGHVKNPSFEGEDAEKFADSFAGALLFPKHLAEKEYNKLTGISNKGTVINKIKDLAEKLLISPNTILTQINAYAENHERENIDLNIHPAAANLNKKYKLLSESIFMTKKPSPENYLKECKVEFGNTFFDSLSRILEIGEPSYSFIQRLLNIPILDAKEIYRVLMNAAD